MSYSESVREGWGGERTKKSSGPVTPGSVLAKSEPLCALRPILTDERVITVAVENESGKEEKASDMAKKDCSRRQQDGSMKVPVPTGCQPKKVKSQDRNIQ